LAEALEEARTEVKSLLRQRLVNALLEEVAAAADPAELEPAAPGADRGVYVYGFSARGACSASGLSGVERSTTYLLEVEDLVAIVSDVAGERHRWGVDANGEPDISLLAPRLEEHQRVLEAVLERCTVLPMRFGTRYPSQQVVSDLVRAHADLIAAELDRLDGKLEWGLTVTWQGSRTGTAGEGHATWSGSPPSPSMASSGRAYLAKREAETDQAERLAQRKAKVAAELHATIGAVAAASVVHPSTRSSGGGSAASALLRSSYLVDRSDRGRFEDVIVAGLQAGAELGLSGELTGPWPPYNFTALELEGAA
jgi:hypothetical protein